MKYKVFLIFAIFWFIGNVHAATVATSPNPAEVVLGETFSVDIVATDFDVQLLGGGLNIHYDPSILRLDYTSVDTSVWDPAMSGVYGGIDESAGEITGLIFNNFNPTDTAEFPVATLGFTATALGMSPIQLSQYNMNPFVMWNEDDQSSGITPVTLMNGSVNVSPVPLPAAAWLMLSGLGLLIGLRRGVIS